MASLQHMRERNRIRLLQALRLAGGADRAELARLTGLSRATVSSLLGEALARGHVVESRPDGTARPALLRLNPRAGIVAGVDLGHSHLRVVLADLGATVVAERCVALDVDAAPDAALAVAADLVGALLRSAGADSGRLLGVGMGVARPLDRGPGAAGFRPAEALALRLGAPVRAENDANLGMLGEHVYGAARGARDVVYLKLSTGVGAGLLLDGSLYMGARGLAGELGHVTVVPNGHICRCGNRGCLETVASASALARALAPTYGDALSRAQLLAVLDGDAVAERSLREVGRHLGRALAPLCTALDVEQVVVGGELGAASRELVRAVRTELRKSCATPQQPAVRPALLGERAEALGGVALALAQVEWLRRAGLIPLNGHAGPATPDGMGAPTGLRDGNVAAVVEGLRQHGSISRTDLARATGLSRTTVLSILDQLSGAGFVALRGSEPERSPGRPAARVALQPPAGVALGLSAGPHQLRLVVADLSLRVLAERTAPYDGRPGAAALADLAVELAGAALAEAGVTHDALVGAALGCPRPIDPHGAEGALQELLSARLGTPVRIDNDANLEGLAELALGAGRGLRHLLYVHAGWGLGGAVVVDERLRRGHAGAAGELAHIRVSDAKGHVCRCGRRGCLRTVASGSALVRALALAHGGELDLDGLLGLVLDGDAAARRALTDAGREIGGVIAGLCTATNPEAVIVGGPLGFGGSPLVAAARRRIARDVHPTIGPVTVLPAALGGVGAALGAASLVVRSGDVFAHRVAVR
jgi:predicted NBD/HSP70 family sugar kinase/DNA-binding MarR family transcriptional regulator